MRDDQLVKHLLCCLTCRGALHLEHVSHVAPDGHILSGTLTCGQCAATFPIVRGVPRFVSQMLTTDVSTTVDGFGYQWQHADPLIQSTRFTASDTFLEFIHPVQPAYFQDKTVLDAGCGSGRFTYWAQQFGAKAVVGVDLSTSVEQAFHNTRHLPNVLVIQADLFALPLQPRFDYVFSIGVLHHTLEPRRAFDAIVRVVSPQGGVSAWVYGRENNAWVVHILNPIRSKLTSRLPRRVLRVLSYIIALPMFLVLKSLYQPVGAFTRLAPLRKHLFYFDYLYFLSRFGVHEQALVVFDHLVPTLAEYIAREEFLQWFAQNNLHNVAITSRAGNSWRGFGVRPWSEASSVSPSGKDNL